MEWFQELKNLIFFLTLFLRTFLKGHFSYIHGIVFERLRNPYESFK